MAKKGKPTYMTNEIVKTIKMVNSRLKALYATFGYNESYATLARKSLSKRVPMTKSGLVSTAAKGYNPDTVVSTVQWLTTVPTVSDMKHEAMIKLNGVYNARATKYKKPVETITEQAIVKQVNAEYFLASKTQDEFEQYYETWLKMAGTKIYDKALEEKLDELFRVGSKHIWTDAEYAEAFASLEQFNELL